MTQAPTPPAAPVAAGKVADAKASPSATYEGLRHQKNVLSDQLGDLTDQRQQLVNQIEQIGPSDGAANRAGLESRLAGLDKSIAGVDAQIAVTDAQLAAASAVPGAVVPTPIVPQSGVPDEAWFLGGMFMVIVFLPLSIAYARRIWKRSATVVTSLPGDLMARIQRIEQSVETSALEIERIGEGQRFMTKILSEQKVPALQPPKDSSPLP